MAQACRRLRRHAEDRLDLLQVHPAPLRRALLRQGAEPAAAPARRLSAIEAGMKWRKHADDFADTLKIASIFSKYTLHRYGGHYYGKAKNLRLRLRAAYDAALATHDLL